jgi:hypothetical protein
VLWGWAGDRLDAGLLAQVEKLAADLDGPTSLAGRLHDLLTAEEVARTTHRAERLASTRRFPKPRPGHPTIPWPAF